MCMVSSFSCCACAAQKPYSTFLTVDKLRSHSATKLKTTNYVGALSARSLPEEFMRSRMSHA